MPFSRLDVYVPSTHVEVLKEALFAAGAGQLGAYDCCCFAIAGQGQFRPLPAAHPFIGTAGGGVEQVAETKLELLCPREKMPAILAALRKAHPYETPAFQYWPVEIQ